MKRTIAFLLLALSTVAPGMASPQASGQEVAKVRTLEESLALAGENRQELEQAVKHCQGSDLEKKSIRFLIIHMPDSDLKTLTAKYLVSNVKFAIQARQATPWGKRVPEAVFLNDVLPYASINERRDDWRQDFFHRFKDLVKDCKTTGEAAQLLNKNVFQILKVRYSTKRKKADQSPYESMETGLASCTGLSVILADACRAVGVPARLAGTPLWVNKRGNHTWVEVWDEGVWKFTGACEYDPNGLNRGWFQGIASKADPKDPRHRIYATSFKQTNGHFPMVWKWRSKEVPGVDVTARYIGKKSTKPAVDTDQKPQAAKRFLVAIQLYDPKGKRIAAKVKVMSGAKSIGSGMTRNDSNDANDFFELRLMVGTYTLIFEHQERQVKREFKVEAKNNQVIKITLDDSDK